MERAELRRQLRSEWKNYYFGCKGREGKLCLHGGKCQQKTCPVVKIAKEEMGNE